MKKFILIAAIAAIFASCTPSNEKVVDSVVTDSEVVTDSVHVELLDGTDSVIVDTIN